MAGVVGREGLGLPDVAAVTLAISGPGRLGVGGGGVGQFGDAEEVEELVVGELGGGLGGPFAFLQGPERAAARPVSRSRKGSWRSTR